MLRDYTDAVRFFENGGTLWGAVDIAPYGEENIIAFKIDTWEKLKAFNWSASCSGWWPYARWGFAETEKEMLQVIIENTRKMHEVLSI